MKKKLLKRKSIKTKIKTFNFTTFNFTTFLTMLLLQNKIFAADLNLITGTQKLINDMTYLLLGLIVVVCVGCLIYFQLRKMSADQQEQTMWDKRSKTAIVALVIGLCASGIINFVASYYMS